MSQLQQALATIRENSSHKTGVGNAFERLIKEFLIQDPVRKQEYKKVWHYRDWAEGRQGFSSKDIGIDLVAELKNESGYCAIQCKCYEPDHSISKKDIDSFISASTSNDFKRLMLVDTTTKPIGINALSVLNNLGNKEYHRLQLKELENSIFDWESCLIANKIRFHSKKELHPHQSEALTEVKKGFVNADRGKMIMACGTGKTFTALRIAEDMAGKGKKVLYMVPSLSLMTQSIQEWKNDAQGDFHAFSVCSDTKVGRRQNQEDKVIINLDDLSLPATTDAMSLTKKIKQESDKSEMIVIFSTYHSIDVISEAQSEYGLDAFDLIICDEAHRTTGATWAGENESSFVKIHSDDHVKGKKRLYMTATPRIYGETVKQKEEEGDYTLASMDDETKYGKVFFHRGFDWAVQNGRLTDYKVVVLAMDKQKVSDLTNEKYKDVKELNLDDATKMVGCYKALAKLGISSSSTTNKTDALPMKRALAFCSRIELSKLFCREFNSIVNKYRTNEKVVAENETSLEVQLEHVDGTFNSETRNKKLDWLKADTEPDTCRVISNVRCLSEGVDVQSLDAIVFLHPRNSQIDIIQSVGRVMRKAKGKELGYVIIPIAVPSGVSADKALDDNERFKVVWQILNALRTHDERMDNVINRISLGEDVSDKIEIIDGTGSSELDSVTDVVNTVPTRRHKPNIKIGIGEENEEYKPDAKDASPQSTQSEIPFMEISQAIRAKIVDKCGTRVYWENWAKDIAKIAEQHIIRITSIVNNPDTPAHTNFINFLQEIRDDLNPDVSESDAIEMLAQHIITRPVFEALFQGNQFTQDNAVSKAMDTVLKSIDAHNLTGESRVLDKFYSSVNDRAKDVKTSQGKQKLINELYERFFSGAFKQMTRKLGIAYTPEEIVDFIIHSVEDVMKEEFNSSIGNKNVHIIDPFVGTGTFISRLLQSGIMSKQQLKRKFTKEIHANEIVLLAYYIACINIEAVYQDIVKDKEYKTFNGMVLTDTFQLYEQEKDMIADLLPDNSERRTAQKKRPITIVIGNPPYSVGKKLANDKDAKVKYQNLDMKISETYGEASTSILKKSLYDSYIRAFRWASDRVGDNGIIGFVTNAGWLDSESTDGMRHCLSNEFSKIYIFHLRGNARTSGEIARKESENVFKPASQTPIAITILVKNKNKYKDKQQAEILFHQLGDYLKKEKKLSKVVEFKSIAGIQADGKFELIKPDKYNDWLNQRNPKYTSLLSICSGKNKNKQSLFANYGPGISSGRDASVYNFSQQKLLDNIQDFIAEYNAMLDNSLPLNRAVVDSKKINWSISLKNRYANNKKLVFSKDYIKPILYRPFTNTNIYGDPALVERPGITSSFFCHKHSLSIVIPKMEATKEFSVMIINKVCDLHFISGGKVLPLFYKDKMSKSKDSLKLEETKLEVKTGISKNALDDVIAKYKKIDITQEDYFFYVYAMLHSEEYSEKMRSNLIQDLPKIFLPKSFTKFQIFAEAGRKLSDLHTKFESAEPYTCSFNGGDINQLTAKLNPEDHSSFFRVSKMKFANRGDKSSVIYNHNITIQNIPLEAYKYVVNQKPALEWVMERQGIKVDKASGIVNDANEYANETMKNPKYPLELFQRVITVSLETTKIIKSLPSLDID